MRFAMAGLVAEFTDDTFQTEVLGSSQPVLVDFWAPWCGPCRQQVPILEKLSQAGDINATIAKVNTDDQPTIAQKFGITSIPTLILFKGGAEAERMVGVQPEAVLRKKLS